MSPVTRDVLDTIMHRRSGANPGADLFGTIDSYAQTPAETSAGLTPANTSYSPVPIDVLRYGILPNDASKATANTIAIRKLLDPSKAGPIGELIFPPIIGSDIYYFNDVIPTRDGIHWNLMGSTLDYTATTTATNNISGLIFVLRDSIVENGTITTHVNTAQSSSGYAIQIGARGSESPNWPVPVYDSTLAVPMGNCTVRNLRINCSNTGANLGSGGCIGIVGGVQGILLQNVTMDGGGNLAGGIIYEFGWATSGTTNLRQTSHANGVMIDNVRVSNLSTAFGYGFIGAGLYDCELRNFTVTSAFAVFNFTPGESLFYRPWVGMDQVGAKRNIRCTNIVGQGITGSALGCMGQQLGSGGYLSAIIAALGHPADYVAETNLLDITVENFAVDGTSNGYGIDNSAGKAIFRNGRITGFLKGVNCSDEAVNMECDGLDIIGCAEGAIAMDFGNAIWSPARIKKAKIHNCFMAGNSTASAGAFSTISVNGNSDGVLIENNRFGHSLGYDGVAEATQGENVFITSANAKNVMCRANLTQFDPASITGSNVCWHNINNTPPSNDHTLQNNSGTNSYGGLWDGVPIAATVTLTAATPGNLAVTYANQNFEYVKVGKRIGYTFRIETSAFTYTTATGLAQISGLPYTASNGAWISTASLIFSGLSKAGYTQITPFVNPNSTLIEFAASGTGTAFANVNITDFPTGGSVVLRGSGEYYAA